MRNESWGKPRIDDTCSGDISAILWASLTVVMTRCTYVHIGLGPVRRGERMRMYILNDKSIL